MLLRNTIYCYSEIHFIVIQKYHLLLFRNTIYCYSEIQFIVIKKYHLLLFRNTIYCYSEIQFTIQRYNLLLFRNTIYWSRWFTQTFQTPSSSITSQFLELPQLGMIPTFQGKLDKSKSKKVFKAVIKTKLSRGGLLQYDPVFIVLDQGEKVINPNHRLESPSRWNLKPIYFSNQIWQNNKVF